MKKPSFALLLALACSSALAEWTTLGDVGNAELFVDPTTIVRTGDTATMWSIYALKATATAGGSTYVSLKRQDEFDCKGARMRGLTIAAYAEPMAGGKLVAEEKGTAGWAPVTPQSTGEKLLKVACGNE